MVNEKKVWEHKIQYYETDQMQVVHHSNYIRWFEEARVFMLESFNLGYDKLEAMGIISPVLSVNAQYKSMSRFAEIVQIDAKITEYNGVKFTISYTVTDKATGVVRCTGESKHCFLEQGKPISLKRSRPELHVKFEEMKA
ncbi:MAG: acyl-CoA thioesterase [Lachnospiraceae bacterium]|nr:acyl-CoA thioesterase [Lachnospiraceae bacterium]